MTDAELRALLIAELGNIAPEAEVAHIDPETDLREALDIDSLDFQNFLAAVHEQTGVNIPERDYGKLVTLNRAIEYLEQALKLPK